MAKNRNYSVKDVDMLMASKTIAENFKSNLEELSAARTEWTENYADALVTSIDEAIDQHLGIDAKRDLRQATSALATIQFPAKRDVSFFKTQIDEDFKNDPAKRDEILKTLGFASHLREVQRDNQEALIQLLYAFKTNMTDTLKQEITAKGMNSSLIDNIVGYADTFKQANVAQETLKETTKEVTKDACNSFNAIYDEIIGICKMASNYYQYEPLKKEQFTFNKVINNLGAARKATVSEGPGTVN